jgi:hypothetical protein
MRLLERPVHKFEENIKIPFNRIGRKAVDWIDLADGRDWW